MERGPWNSQKMLEFTSSSVDVKFTLIIISSSRILEARNHYNKAQHAIKL